MKLDTNQGFNAYAVLIPAIGIIDSMPEGTWKSILLGIVCFATMIVGFRTVGDQPEAIDEHADIGDVLKKGREE